MGRFEFDENEILDKKCCEIFLTTKGRTKFQCTLCDEAYCGFESYQYHLNETHLSTTIKLEIELMAIEAEGTFDKRIDDSDLKSEGSVYLLDNDNALEDTNIPYSETRRKKRSTQANGVNVPKEIREIVKRAVYKQKSTPELERKHKCPICGYGFKDKSNMVHHLKRHSDEQKTHVCSECGKKFFTSTELNSHRNLHTQERSYLCTECGSTFKRPQSLKAHLKRHQNLRDYLCPHTGCEKSFFNSSLLKNHMLTHCSDRRFRCFICDAAFKQRVALKTHLKLHANKREYKCKLCDAGFNQTAGLFSHMKAFHKTIQINKEIIEN